MSPNLPAMPSEVLKRVVLYAICDVPGPPGEFYSLSLTCKTLLRRLNNAELHYGMLTAKFETQSPLRRLGRSLLKQQAKAELRRRFEILKRIRTDSLAGDSVTEALWTAYIMLEDINLGSRCFKHLLWAKLPGFLDRYLHDRLYEGSETNDGWPVLTATNSLAIALSWLCLDQVCDEKEVAREKIMHLLKPIVFAAFRYPIFGMNEYFHDAYGHMSRSSRTNHGSYPPDPLPASQITYFGKIASKALAPLAPLFASMIYFARFERVIPMIPPHLRRAPHRTRAEASTHNRKGPTLEDVMEFVDDCHTRFVQAGTCRSLRHHVRLSMDLDHRSPYSLGLLTGRWKGSYILPFVDDYQSWLRSSSAPIDFKTTGRLPLFLSLQEHYVCEQEDVLPHDDEENGTLHAWLPPGCSWEKKKGGIEIFDDRNSFRKFYRTYQPEEVSHDLNVVDIVVTGETDDRHAAAWGAYNVIGRIRLKDGLIMLQRHSLDGYGTTLMRGYVTPCNNLVGRLKGASTGIAPSGWEGVFILCNADI